MRSSTVLITGIDGFIASHLAGHILGADGGATVVGTIRRMADRRNIRHIIDQIGLVEMELTDPYSVHNAVKKVQPDVVFHLAAQSFVPTSWEAPASTIEVNAVGTVNVLEAVRKVSPYAFVQLASSSEAYGLVHPEECPITEANPLRPLSPYAVSKAATDYLGFQYARSYNMDVCITRTFNQTGPRRGEAFVDSNFASQIARIECRYQPAVIRHGNLEAVRDFLDVRDTVEAYWKLAHKPCNGEVFNICSGRGRSIREVLETLLGMSRVGIELQADPERMRPSDVPRLIGSNAKLRGFIEWEPRIPWEQSLSDLLDDWRERW